MADADTRAVGVAEVEHLRVEKDALLDELATAYLHLEQILGTRQYETDLAYQELRKRNQELLARYAELQRAHERLRETQRLLVRAERLSAMGQMAAAIVHEINNPLTAISGRVDLLLMRDDVSHRQELVRVQEATHALRDLTRNILRFSRRRSGEEAAARLDLNAIVDEVVTFFAPLVKDLELVSRPGTDLPPVFGVATQVEQVLTNLLVNAIDALDGVNPARLVVATGEGTIAQFLGASASAGREVRLAIAADDGDLERQQAWVAVEDTGPGIEASVLAQVFEAFFTTKGEDRGTGLGLSICRSIAESLQANVVVASRVGDGAAFRLFLRTGDEDR